MNLCHLRCLYDDGAETALLAARVALDTLRDDVMVRGREALVTPRATFSGITIGQMQDGEGVNEKQIAVLWLQSLSSLFDPALALRAEAIGQPVVSDAQKVTAKSDRLPVLVYQFIEKERLTLAQAFKQEIREPMTRRRSVNVQDVYIAFAGSRIAANFATLPATKPRSTIDHIKRLMWDLARDRDRHPNALNNRRSEMIVHHQDKSEPQITESQYEGVLEVIDELGA